jgi:hypothetical protein
LIPHSVPICSWVSIASLYAISPILSDRKDGLVLTPHRAISPYNSMSMHRPRSQPRRDPTKDKSARPTQSSKKPLQHPTTMYISNNRQACILRYLPHSTPPNAPKFKWPGLHRAALSAACKANGRLRSFSDNAFGTRCW